MNENLNSKLNELTSFISFLFFRDSIRVEYSVQVS